MTPRRRPWGWIAWLPALGICGGPAHAALSSAATVTITGYSLLDLDPTDGVAPSISFLPGETVVKGVRVLTSAVSYDQGYQSTPGTANAYVVTPDADTLGAGVAQAEVSTASGRAELRFSGVVGATASAQGQTTGFNPAGIDLAAPYVQGFGMYGASAGLNLNFELSAHTAVTFHFEGSTVAPVSGFAIDGSSSSVFILASLGDSRGRAQFNAGGTFAESLAAFNLGNAPGVGNLTLNANVSGILSTPAPAVPEPGAAWLAVAGAALVGVWAPQRARRRANRQGAHA